jgi:hypothetical protein
LIIANTLQLDSDMDGYGNACDGDYDQDGDIDDDDAAFWETPGLGCVSPSPPAICDHDGNGNVNGTDVSAYFIPQYIGGVPGPSGYACAGTVPCLPGGGGGGGVGVPALDRVGLSGLALVLVSVTIGTSLRRRRRASLPAR